MSSFSSLHPTDLGIQKAYTSESDNNPIRVVISHYQGLVSPHFPEWALALLIVFAIFRGIIILCCGAIMVLPALKGPESRKRHYFLARWVGSKEFRGPCYLVPNRGMVIILGEFCSGILYFITACVNYWTYTQPWIPEGTHITTWYSIAMVPSYIGIWMAGWALVHSCFCDVEVKIIKRASWRLTPSVYNSIWLAWLSILVVFVSILTMIVDFEFAKFETNVNHVTREAEKIAQTWDITHTLSSQSFSNMVTGISGIYQILNIVSFKFILFARFWTAFEILLALFYLVTVCYLLRILRKVLYLRDAEAIAPRSLTPIIWSALEDEFRYLSWFSFLVTISISCQIVVFLFNAWAFKPANLQVAKIRIMIAIFDQLPGILMAPTHLFQAWRIMAEKYKADESIFGTVEINFKNRAFPQLASQLLGWDTTEHWGQRSKVENEPFRDLFELDSTMSIDKSEGTCSKPAAWINITRSIVTTADTA